MIELLYPFFPLVIGEHIGMRGLIIEAYLLRRSIVVYLFSPSGYISNLRDHSIGILHHPIV